MGMPRILPMRKPDPRFMSRLMVSVAQEFDGSGEGRARCEPTRAPLGGVGRVRRNERVPPPPGVLRQRVRKRLKRKELGFCVCQRVRNIVKRKSLSEMQVFVTE